MEPRLSGYLQYEVLLNKVKLLSKVFTAVIYQQDCTHWELPDRGLLNPKFSDRWKSMTQFLDHQISLPRTSFL